MNSMCIYLPNKLDKNMPLTFALSKVGDVSNMFYEY
jgi:hypothetical protein